ncbi:MAG: ImmA/IrrE family metallo-endopeptidase [Candidatus Binataceae bacterium]
MLDVHKVASLFGLRIEKVADVRGLRGDHRQIEIDEKVPGALYREEAKIVVVEGSTVSRQRYTIAHEIGHWVLHSGSVQFRETIPAKKKMHAEREAEEFAANLLMPEPIAREAANRRFGGSIESCLENDNIAHNLAVGTGRKLTPRELACMPQLDRSSLFARAKSFGGPQFAPLCELFDVSVDAMGRRLLELGLVS